MEIWELYLGEALEEKQVFYYGTEGVHCKQVTDSINPEGKGYSGTLKLNFEHKDLKAHVRSLWLSAFQSKVQTHVRDRRF